MRPSSSRVIATTGAVHRASYWCESRMPSMILLRCANHDPLPALNGDRPAPGRPGRSRRMYTPSALAMRPLTAAMPGQRKASELFKRSCAIYSHNEPALHASTMLKRYVCVLHDSSCAPLVYPWSGEVEGASMAMHQAKVSPVPGPSTSPCTHVQGCLRLLRVRPAVGRCRRQPSDDDKVYPCSMTAKG